MDVLILGRDEVGLVAEEEGVRFHLTECCLAVATGSISSSTAVRCPTCYREVRAELTHTPSAGKPRVSFEPALTPQQYRTFGRAPMWGTGR